MDHHRRIVERKEKREEGKEKEVEKRIGIERKVAKSSSADECSTLAENNTPVRAMDRDKQEGEQANHCTRVKKKAHDQKSAHTAPTARRRNHTTS